MDQFTLNLIVIGLSFALYFGIAFWARAASTAEFYAAGQGVLFLTPHLGCFEVSAQALCASFSQKYGPLTVLFRPARKEGFGKVMEASRARPGLETATASIGW